ncbi:phospholipase D family protein [Curtobacterium aurantiacum]|uniref:phospholipase D family protein n=1 Tax=Curtobacterium aurantiacum TaxID=3236919 RepID=UPI001BDEF8F9|nr:phospholipase D family protein [Curtobacterium flaccumfaciens]MBT1679790.1 phospholipase D family protein [Curtobacterium flaccumfaciens pv. flaccumfaciens]
MLEPQNRATLTEQLRPPTGFELVHAVGTTFTLGLDTALSVPLAFAARGVAEQDDPIAILDAVRRAADRIDVFAQAGEIAIGTRNNRLVAFLEPMLHPVTVPTGIFHPKVWFLEFRSGDASAFRFVCASRNLTSDRSWDVVVSLDGTPGDTADAASLEARNAPIVGLLRSLPGSTVVPLAPERTVRIAGLAARFAGVEWETPEDLEDLRFHVWQSGAPARPDLSGERALVVSPFLQDGALATIRGGIGRDLLVVSRSESLNRLSDGMIGGRTSAFVLDAAADPAEEVEAAHLGVLRGLHAKVIVVNRERRARVLLGSLNATDAALHSNVEVMVELVGSAARFGVEATRKALGDLIVEHTIEPVDEADADDESGGFLDAVLRGVAGTRMQIDVEGDGPYQLRVSCDDAVADTDDVAFSWRLLTRVDDVRKGLPSTVGSWLEAVALADVTPYLVVTARDGEGTERSTVVLADLHGDPDDRLDAVIASHLSTPADFMRFITLLLELVGLGTAGSGTGLAWNAAASTSGDLGAGLFESLIRSVGTHGHGLADVDRVVQYLRGRGDTSLLPEGFDGLWASVWDAQRRLEGER